MSFDHSLAALSLLSIAACASSPGNVPARAEPSASNDEARVAASITPDALLRHITTLSSDRFEGRAPGTHGEELTVAYLEAELRRAGLAPGNRDGSYVQTVPMVAITSRPSLSFEAGPAERSEGAKRPTRLEREGDDYVMWSYGTTADVRIDHSELVFVGYGVVAPELDWDDFKDVDVRGKTVVMLVGDPPVTDPRDSSKLDERTFRGAAMTYYGRWTYKFEIAAKKGAAAALIVHETGPAGYGWNVVAGGGARERYEIATHDARNAHVAAEGWITERRARELLAVAGQDWAAAKAAAARRDFRPTNLGPARANIAIHSTTRDVVSKNVIARLAGSDASVRDEHVLYSAHWDHFGRGPDGSIFHGALDNASGVAWLLESARAFASLRQAPRRSLLFAAFTAEEQGLLGSKYYGAHPLFPLERTIADINMDIMNPWGPTRSIVSIGFGQTTMDAVLASEAKRQGRTVVPDPEPEKGYYYRSDHFELAKRGVPSLGFLFPGADYVDRPPGFGAERRQAYVARSYHSPRDVVEPDWDLRGAAADTQLLFHVGARVADGASWPAWNPGTEFRDRR